MILKSADDKSDQLKLLENLLQHAPANSKAKIESYIRNLKAGLAGERKTSFYIDDYFKNSTGCFVIHDLRIDWRGRVAQIDHLLINRLFEVFVLETKHFHAGVKINESGEFLRWNNFAKKHEGMPSPLSQNERHIEILKDLFDQFIVLPTRLGFTLKPSYHSRVLVNPEARIDRPRKFDTRQVLKADDFCRDYQSHTDGLDFLSTVSSLAKVVSSEEAEHVARQLIRMHKPLKPDFAAMFGVSPPTTLAAKAENEVAQESKVYSGSRCSKCSSLNIAIEYGRYGYYFKCKDCEGNTAIKITCGMDGHKERIRKEGNVFYRECADCKTSKIFFTNAP